MNLQPKYYFVLGEESPAVLSELAGNVLGRAQGDRPIERFALADNLDRAAASIDDRQAQWFPLSAERAGELNVGWEWLDYESSAPGLLVLSLPGTDDVTLRVVAGKQQGPEWLIERQLAARHFSVSELSPHGLRRGLLDTWDRPKSLGPKATFFGRVIAVLKQIEGRAAVDFYGEALHEDSDCRVWLPQLEGQAVAIRFVELPIIKESDVAVPVTVLAVRYEDATDGSQVIALDYPLCSPPILEQLRRLAGNRTSAGAEPAAGPDLAKLIGEDVLDEFSRRLVAGTYR